MNSFELIPGLAWMIRGRRDDFASWRGAATRLYSLYTKEPQRSPGGKSGRPPGSAKRVQGLRISLLALSIFALRASTSHAGPRKAPKLQCGPALAAIERRLDPRVTVEDTNPVPQWSKLIDSDDLDDPDRWGREKALTRLIADLEQMGIKGRVEGNGVRIVPLDADPKDLKGKHWVEVLATNLNHRDLPTLLRFSLRSLLQAAPEFSQTGDLDLAWGALLAPRVSSSSAHELIHLFYAEQSARADREPERLRRLSSPREGEYLRIRVTQGAIDYRVTKVAGAPQGYTLTPVNGGKELSLTAVDLGKLELTALLSDPSGQLRQMLPPDPRLPMQFLVRSSPTDFRTAAGNWYRDRDYQIEEGDAYYRWSKVMRRQLTESVATLDKLLKQKNLSLKDLRDIDHAITVILRSEESFYSSSELGSDFLEHDTHEMETVIAALNSGNAKIDKIKPQPPRNLDRMIVAEGRYLLFRSSVLNGREQATSPDLSLDPKIVAKQLQLAVDYRKEPLASLNQWRAESPAFFKKLTNLREKALTLAKNQGGTNTQFPGLMVQGDEWLKGNLDQVVTGLARPDNVFSITLGKGAPQERKSFTLYRSPTDGSISLLTRVKSMDDARPLVRYLTPLFYKAAADAGIKGIQKPETSGWGWNMTDEQNGFLGISIIPMLGEDDPRAPYVNSLRKWGGGQALQITFLPKAGKKLPLAELKMLKEKLLLAYVPEEERK